MTPIVLLFFFLVAESSGVEVTELESRSKGEDSWNSPAAMMCKAAMSQHALRIQQQQLWRRLYFFILEKSMEVPQNNIRLIAQVGRLGVRFDSFSTH